MNILQKQLLDKKIVGIHEIEGSCVDQYHLILNDGTKIVISNEHHTGSFEVHEPGMICGGTVKIHRDEFVKGRTEDFFDPCCMVCHEEIETAILYEAGHESTYVCCPMCYEQTK